MIFSIRFDDLCDFFVKFDLLMYTFEKKSFTRYIHFLCKSSSIHSFIWMYDFFLILNNNNNNQK